MEGGTPCKSAFDEDEVLKANNDPLPVPKMPLSKVCHDNDAQNCLPASVKLRRNITYVPSRTTKTLTCVVHKSMSTVLHNLACFLDDPLKFLMKKGDFLETQSGRDCIQYKVDTSRLVSNDGQVSDVRLDDTWQYLMVVRDPIDRFLSGYLHFCYYGLMGSCRRFCNNCGANLTCFLEREFQNMMEVVNGEIPDSKTSHLFPQSWHCEINAKLNKYHFIHYQSDSAQLVDNQLTPYFKSRNVSTQMIDYIRRRLISARTKHSTSASSAKPFLLKRIKESAYLQELLVRLFYNDYEIFGFKWSGFMRQ